MRMTKTAIRRLVHPDWARAAMSLVEVILALGITAFAAVTIMGLLSVALRHNGESAERAIFVNIYRSAMEAIKTTAESSEPAQTWTQDIFYDREATATAATNAAALYRASVSAQTSAAWPGETSTNAWNIHLAIKNIPQDKVIFERSMILVKAPPGSATTN